jgi:Spy/CpxP family protein refolding chaperone
MRPNRNYSVDGIPVIHVEIEFQIQQTTAMNNRNLSNNARRGLSLIVGAAALSCAAAANAAEPLPTPEEMWRIIQMQQKQITELTARLDAAEGDAETTQQALVEAEAKVEATTAYVEQLQETGGTRTAPRLRWRKRHDRFSSLGLIRRARVQRQHPLFLRSGTRALPGGGRCTR